MPATAGISFSKRTWLTIFKPRLSIDKRKISIIVLLQLQKINPYRLREELVYIQLELLFLKAM